MTALFPTSTYDTGVAGTNLNATVEFGTGGTITGSGTAKYDTYPGGMRAKYTATGNSVQGNRIGTFGAGAILYSTFMVEHFDSTSDGHPAVQFNFMRYDQNANNTTIASLGMGTAGGLQLNGALDVKVADSLFMNMITGKYVMEWMVNTTTGQQTLDVYDYGTGYWIEQLSGTCGTGTVTRYREGIMAGTSNSTIYLENVSSRNDYLQYPWYARLPFCFQILPTQTRFDWTTQTQGVNQVRVHCPVTGQSSDWQVPDDWGLTYHYLEGFSSDTRYSFVVQGVEINTGLTKDLKTISNKTAKPDNPVAYTYKTGILACTKTGSKASLPWTHAISRDLDNIWLGGDWYYLSTEVNDPRYHFRRLILQYNVVPGMRDALEYYGAFYNPSDHDFLANNGQTGGNVMTIAFQTAWRRMFPQYANQFLSEKNLSWAREVGNGILEIYWDFRNYERTDSDSVSVPYDSPLRAAFGPEFMSWLADLMAGDWRYIIIYSDPVWLSKVTAGVEGPLTAKTDAFASYVFTRDQISAMMSGATDRGIGGLLVVSDMHSINATIGAHNPHGGWNSVGAAATDQTLVYKGGEYDQYFPDRTLPGTTPLSVWGEILLSDNVGNIALEYNGWDCLTNPGVPTKQVHLTDTHYVTGDGTGVAGGGISPDWNLVHCFWRGKYGDGSPITGELHIRPVVDRFLDDGTPQSLGIFAVTQVVPIVPAYLPFQDKDGNSFWTWVGAADVFLPPTDDADIFGVPFEYVCIEVLGKDAHGNTFNFTVPSAAVDVDLTKLGGGLEGLIPSEELMQPKWTVIP